MEEKTEQLRDIFMDVAGEESVTETQAEQRGSLVRNESVDDRLADVVARMRDRFEFETALETDALPTLVRRFYDGDGDGEIADALDTGTDEVFAARMDLHLVRDEEGANPDRVREFVDEGLDDAAIADALDTDTDQVARARRALAAERRSRRVSQRFRTEFEEVLTDADIAVQLTADVREDGLDEAAEDIETDVDF